MRPKPHRLLLLLAVLPLAACTTMTAYVDPQFRKARYETLPRPAQPVPVVVVAHFQRNGIDLPSMDPSLQRETERVLATSGVFAPGADAPGKARIDLVADNVIDKDLARSQGIKSGLTLGLAGKSVADGYEFRFAYRRPDGTLRSSTQRHVIHSTVGQAPPPVDAVPMTIDEAFDRVVEDAVLNFVAELQASKALVPPPPAEPAAP